MSSVTLHIFVDPNEPGSAALTTELERQLRALGVGELTTVKRLPPPGTLTMPDPDTIIIVLKIAFWSVKVGRAVIELIREARERSAAEKQVDPKGVPKVLIATGAKQPTVIAVPGTKKDQESFINAIDKDGAS